jgi:hypothetical protein
MVERPTLFVLGAGASAPYGFPTGASLVGRIITTLDSGPKVLDAVAAAAECETGTVVKFARALRFSGTKSVDFFLEGRGDLIEVGKVAIAAALIPFENEETLFGDRPGSWYPTLLDRMGGTADQFAKNSLRIITYNYDRSLEHFLITALRHRFNIGQPQAVQLLDTLPILHLHGQLGSLWDDGSTVRYRQYRPEWASVPELANAATGISIIHEDIGAYPAFATAQKWIQEAEQIFFLGFGYHPTNLHRLALGARQGNIQGTGWGLLNAEIAMIQQVVQPVALQIAPEHEDVLEFLRRHWVTKLEPRR